MLFSKYAHTIGQSAETFLAETSIDPERVFSDPDSRVDDAKIIRLCDKLEQKGDNVLLGYQIGKKMEIGNWGVLGHLMNHSPNLEIANRYLASYAILLSENRRVCYKVEGNHSTCSISNPLSDWQLQITWQTYAAVYLRILKLLSDGKVQPKWLSFPKGSVLSSRELSNCLDVDVLYGGSEITIGYNRRDLLKPNPNADPYLERIFLGHAQKQYEDLQGNEGLIEQVLKHMSFELADGQLAIHRIAQAMDMSERSLQRHLAKEGTSYAKILNQFRANNACKLLDNQSLSISQIAETLGYQSSSSFHRAFQRWKDMPPMQYRENS